MSLRIQLLSRGLTLDSIQTLLGTWLGCTDKGSLLKSAVRTAFPFQRMPFTTQEGVRSREWLPSLGSIINVFATYGFFFAEGNVANACVDSVNGQKPA